jgi:hypothetical protein
MRLLVMFFAAALATGCTAVIGGDFGDRYPTPTACSPSAPTTADPTKFLRCASTETCVRDASKGAATCVPIGNAAGVGEGCKYADGCNAGLVCLSIGFCARSCIAGSNDCGAGSTCLAFTDGATSHGEQEGFCVGAGVCDPMNPANAADGFTPCADGSSCRFVDGTTTCLETPAPAYPRVTCASDMTCAASSVCAASERVCRAVCRVGDDTACGPGLFCRSGVDAQITGVANGVEFGYCDHR